MLRPVNNKPTETATPAVPAGAQDKPQTEQTRGQAIDAGRMTSRSVRSFVVRNGRITPAQQRALDVLLPVYGVTFQQQAIDPVDVFGRDAPLWVETGFGNGDALISMAERYPQNNFLGIEVHAPGVGHLLHDIQQLGLKNIRVIRHDAHEVFESMLAPRSVQRALVFFPDPWPKKRHHKRRILQEGFVSVIEKTLPPGGVLHCATDWQEYAEWILELLQSREKLNSLSAANSYADRPDYRPATRFEQRGRNLGHEVFDLLFEKTDS